MKIAILGWGSLVWNPSSLHLASNWLEGGPVLPIEFSRISDNGRLTLVIDERHGVDNPTCYAHSSLNNLEAAITNLQKREDTPYRNRIGFIDITRKVICATARRGYPPACKPIQAWAAKHKFSAVVWTAIGPRFLEKIGVPFSANAAVAYIAGLQEPTRTLALDYVRKAPGNVITPVREKLSAAFGGKPRSKNPRS